MKATGIVRRIDGLSRVVIPKELRRTMRIREGGSAVDNIDTVGAIHTGGGTDRGEAESLLIAANISIYSSLTLSADLHTIEVILEMGVLLCRISDLYLICETIPRF